MVLRLFGSRLRTPPGLRWISFTVPTTGVCPPRERHPHLGTCSVFLDVLEHGSPEPHVACEIDDQGVLGRHGLEVADPVAQGRLADAGQ